MRIKYFYLMLKITTLGQIRPGSNSNEELLRTEQSSKFESLPPDVV